MFLAVILIVQFFVNGMMWAKTPTAKLKDKVVLSVPAKGTLFTVGDIIFAWRYHPGRNTENRLPLKYELLIWSRDKTVQHRFTAYPGADDDLQVYTLSNLRTFMRRPGRYFWRIVAVFEDGTMAESPESYIQVGLSYVSPTYQRRTNTIEISWQYYARQETGDYRTLIEQVYPKAPLDSYADFGFHFYQNRLLGKEIYLGERIFVMSPLGMGIGLEVNFQLLTTPVIALFPRGSYSLGCMSSSLREYNLTVQTARIGLECIIMPAGNISISADWVPANFIRYGTSDNELKTFEGEGFEYGLRLIIPSSLVKPFSLGGLRIDLSKMPLYYSISDIKDSYTGISMKTKHLSIGILL